MYQVLLREDAIRTLTQCPRCHLTFCVCALTETEAMIERRERTREYAKLSGVSVDGYSAAHGDRWYPSWDAKDRAWLAKDMGGGVP